MQGHGFVEILRLCYGSIQVTESRLKMVQHPMFMQKNSTGEASMFKKTRIAAVVLAVATAPAAFAASEVALHGDFRGSVDHTSASGVGSGLNWQDNSSRFGIEASTTHQGLRAFVNYERLVSNDGGVLIGVGEELTLAFYGGVEGSLGKIYYGTAPTAFRNATKSIDPFFNTSLAGGSIFSGATGDEAVPIGASTGLRLFDVDFQGAGYAQNTIGYVSPNMGGLTFNASVNLDEQSKDLPGSPGERHDYAAGVTFQQDGLTAGLQYANTSARSGNYVLGKGSSYFAYAKLDLGVAEVSGAYQRFHDTDGGANYNGYFVAGTMPLSDVMRLSASIGVERPSTDPSTTATGGNIGVFYDVMPNLTTYGGLRYTQQNDGAGNSLGGESIAVGVSYSFRVAHAM
jgi:hypothetical protein